MSEFDPTAWWAPFLAFAAGIVAFASPCVLPLVPGYLSFVTAAADTPGSPSAPTHAHRIFVPVLLFVAGFSVVFTSLGAFAGVVVPVVRSTTGQRVAGLVVLAVGVYLVLYALRVGSPFLFGERRPLLARVRPGGATAFPLGMAFAAGWTPCIGPVLAGTLALAATPVQSCEERAPAVRVLDGLGDPVRPHRARRGRGDAAPRRSSTPPPRDRGWLRLTLGRDRTVAGDRSVDSHHVAAVAAGELVRASDLIQSPSPAAGILGPPAASYMEGDDERR